MSKLERLISQSRERLSHQISAELDEEIRAASADLRRNILRQGPLGETVTPDGDYTNKLGITQESIQTQMGFEDPFREDTYASAADVPPTFDYAPLDTPEIEFEPIDTDFEPEV